MATYRENEEFLESVFNNIFLLDEAIDWIQCKFDIDDIFTEEQIEDYIKENGYTKED